MTAIGVVLAAMSVLVWPASRARAARHAASDPVAVPVHRSDESVLDAATALDLIGLALTSGIPLVQAVEEVAAGCEPVIRAQLQQVVAALRWGVSEADAWRGLPPVWQPAAQALGLAGASGVPPAGMLKRAAADLRRSEQRRLEEAAGRLSVLVVVPLGLCFLPAFAVLTVIPVVAALARQVLLGMS